MYIPDLTAIDRLIDIYGSYMLAVYKNKKYELEDLRDYFEENKMDCSLDLHKVDKHGIMDLSFNYIVEVMDIDNYHKDDLTKI
jgi:hypothetical protein